MEQETEHCLVSGSFRIAVYCLLVPGLHRASRRECVHGKGKGVNEVPFSNVSNDTFAPVDVTTNPQSLLVWCRISSSRERSLSSHYMCATRVGRSCPELLILRLKSSVGGPLPLLKKPVSDSSTRILGDAPLA